MRGSWRLQTYMVGPRDLKDGGQGWFEQLKSAIREAVADAVTEHQKAGYPVYFTEDAGCLCVIMPFDACLPPTLRSLLRGPIRGAA